jgi:exosortase E/protease (VPEID-CTERM system)
MIGLAGHVWLLGVTALLVLRPINGAVFRAVGSSARRALMAAHVASFVTFFAISFAMFGRFEAPPGPVGAWVAGWALCGGATVLTVTGALIGVPIRATTLILRAVLVGGLLAWLSRWLGTWSQDLWQPLSLATLSLVAGVLRPLFSDLFVDAPALLIGLGDYIVEIAPGCSGFEGIGLITVLMTAYLAAFRRQLRFPEALWLLPLGMALVWLGNVLRIALLIVIGSRLDPGLAEGGFHSKAGWVLFCAVALGLASLGQRSKTFCVHATDGDDVVNPVAAYLMPVLAVIGTTLVVAVFSPSEGVADGARILAACVALYPYRSEYRLQLTKPALFPVLAGLGAGVAWALTAPTIAHAGGAPGPSHVMTALGSVLRVTAFVAVAPVCEELAFRGYLVRRLVSADFLAVSATRVAPVAILVSSLAFGLLHERWLAATVCGALYAGAVAWRGRLADCVAAHAATNAVIAAWALATGNAAVWG